MATRQIAQGLAGLGRHGDSMLMHVSPDEVAGIQHLGKMHGISLTTNPHTGLPEAFSFGNFFKTMAPTIAGVIAAPATGGMSMAPILAGAATGAGIAAASGDNILTGGLMGGLGGYGGGQLGNGLAGMGTAQGAGTGTAGMGTATLNPGTAVDAFNHAVVPEAVASATPDVVAAASPELANQTAANVAQFGAMDGSMGATPTFESMGQGIKNIGQDGSWDAFRTGMGGTGPQVSDTRAAMGIGLPLGASYLAGSMPTMEEPKKDKYDPNKSLNLSGDTGLRLYAQGGITSLYGSPDGTQAQNTFNENYGLGRLNELSNAGSMEQAKFNSNGYSAPAQQPYGGAQYNPPTMNQQSMQMNQQPQMGQLQQMGGFGGFNSMGPQNAFTPQPRFAKGGLADGGFVVPADVVSHLGNGSTDAGLKHLHRSMGAKPIRGAGDGMSDSIKTTIEGKQPARIADGEAYIPPEVVKQRGGAKNLYNMMNKVRKSRTGTTKQGKQINPNKFMP
tara:strand:- start:11919 stop:13427 length:1509 start_codon:yes stop_codon:yes gene_type:complete